MTQELIDKYEHIIEDIDADMREGHDNGFRAGKLAALVMVVADLRAEQEEQDGSAENGELDDQFSVCSGCEDESEYETETTEANCGECHRRYYCEASPDSCIYSKIEQAESEKVDDEIRVGDEVIYQRKSSDPHNGEKGVVIGIGGNWREVRFLSNWSSVGVHKDSLIKTGRHFSQIEEVLKQIQEVEE